MQYTNLLHIDFRHTQNILYCLHFAGITHSVSSAGCADAAATTLQKAQPMTQLRAVIYARYSSNLQREASIEDQIHECRALTSRLGAEIIELLSDAAINGSLEQRPGLQSLFRRVRKRGCQHRDH